MAMEVVLHVPVRDENQKQEVMHRVTSLPGIVSLRMEDMKLIVVGSVEPLDVIENLREYKGMKILSVVPVGVSLRRNSGDPVSNIGISLRRTSDGPVSTPRT